MKQLEKLRSEGSRLLTDDQMKHVKGGASAGSCPRPVGPGPHQLCGGLLCEVVDYFGNTIRGVCNASCECDTAGIIPPTLD